MTQTLNSFPFSAQSCFKRMEAARPAGPPPTIKTSKGIASLGTERGSSASEEKHRGELEETAFQLDWDGNLLHLTNEDEKCDILGNRVGRRRANDLKSWARIVPKKRQLVLLDKVICRRIFSI